MEPAILTMQFPLGPLPVKGAKCPECGEEVFIAGQVEQAQETARRLGLFGPELKSTRKAIELGSSTGMTFEREIAKRAGIRPGTELEIDFTGGRIIIYPKRAIVKGTTKKSARRGKSKRKTAQR